MPEDSPVDEQASLLGSGEESNPGHGTFHGARDEEHRQEPATCSKPNDSPEYQVKWIGVLILLLS